jgi:dihydroorotate dehydrogenase
MYKSIIRPLLFKLYPETVHHLVTRGLKIAFKVPFAKVITQSFFTHTNPKLQRTFLSMHFKNPIGLAAGFDKDARYYKELAAFGFSFIEIGTVTPKPQSGNEKPRSFRIPSDKGLINRMGFNNLGVEQAVERLKNRKPGLIIGGNIGKNTATPNEKAVDDYDFCFRKLYDYVDYFVVNVSCPNVTNLKELQDKEHLGQILERVTRIRKEQQVYKPVLLKISPDLNFAQVDDTLNICAQCGIDGLVVSNTTVTREGLTTPAERITEIGRGGMSGAPIRSRSTQLIQYISNKTNGKLPIIGVGGIFSAADAIEKLNAGATLVQVYTGFIYEGPAIVRKINKELVKLQ